MTRRQKNQDALYLSKVYFRCRLCRNVMRHSQGRTYRCDCGVTVQITPESYEQIVSGRGIERGYKFEN